jgi:DNA polymerase-3 subunit beta
MTNLAIKSASAIIPRAELRHALAIAKKVSERKNTIPILSNSLIRGNGAGVELVSTNLDIQITIKLPGAAGDSEFAVTLPTHTLADIEKKAPETENVALDSPVVPFLDHMAQDTTPKAPVSPEKLAHNAALDIRASLDFEGLRVTMQHRAAQDFPAMEWTGGISGEFDVSSADLLALINATEFAISSEETRHYLNGIFLHAVKDDNGAAHLCAVATDGHRLAKKMVPLESCAAMAGVIIPRAVVTMTRDLCKAKGAPETVRVKINSTKAVFTFGNVELFFKLIDGTFPDYVRVIPRGNERRVTFNVKALAKAIGAVTCIASERGRAVKLTLSPDESRGVLLTVKNPDAGEANIFVPCDYTGEAMEIGFNAQYVLDTIAKIEGETVTFHLADKGSPALVTETGASGLTDCMVLMPKHV